MVGLALILVAVVTSLLAGACLRLESLSATLLASYVAFVANLGLVTLVLSPTRDVTRGGLAGAELVLLAAAGAAWWRLGRPLPQLASARAALREVASDRWTLLYLAAIGLLLGYELVLALTVPPNNWDSLTYHLARVAAWYHHGGIYWVPNAPTDRINEFQPLAEQQIYFLFAATGTGRLYAVPQYLAQLAILLAVYASARRLGFGVRPSACAACLLATFGLLAYETTTAQNDLVAGALAGTAACFLLNGGRAEGALAGLAAVLGLGVKLTTVLIWPVLIALALLRGRRTVAAAAIGAAAGFAAIACWSFVLNLDHTGHLLGHGGGRVEHTASPSFPGSLVTLLSILYTTMDLSILWPIPIVILTLAGLAAAAVCAWRLRAGDRRTAAEESARVALPFAAPALVILGAAVLAAATRALGHPVRGPGGSLNQLGFFGGLTNNASEDTSAFGPIGGVVLLGVPILVAAAAVNRRVDRRQLVLAAALPTFLILLALGSEFNAWLTRFLIVPVVLTAPLLARLFRGRATTAAYLVVSVTLIALGITRLESKRLFSDFGAPWNLTESAALAEAGHADTGRALPRLDAAVPPGAPLGAVLAGDGDSYLTDGMGIGRRLVYLPPEHAATAAEQDGLEYVLVSTQPDRRPAARDLAARGWRVRPIGGSWLLAVAPIRLR